MLTCILRVCQQIYNKFQSSIDVAMLNELKTKIIGNSSEVMNQKKINLLMKRLPNLLIKFSRKEKFYPQFLVYVKTQPNNGFSGAIENMKKTIARCI